MTAPAGRQVRVELNPEAIFNRVFVDGVEWAASVTALTAAVDQGTGSTRIELTFYGLLSGDGRAHVDARLPKGWTCDPDGRLVPPVEED